MFQGTYCIASHTFSICSLYEDVQMLCSDYRSADTPEFTITITEEDIHRESVQSDETRRNEGLPPYTFSEGYLETLAVYRKLAERLLSDDILLFHGSAVAVDGQCYIFTAKSGTGKSTHVRLWRKVLGERAVMVNDDKPLIRIKDGVAMVYGTPWDGKHRLSTNMAVPLKAIAVLQRGERNCIAPLGVKEAFPLLLQQTYRPEDRLQLLKAMQLLGKMAENVNLYVLHCNMEEEAAKVAFEGMSHEQI